MKFREIGSNFFTDKFPLSDEVNDDIIKAKYGLKYNIIYPSLGRNAISFILKSLNQKKRVALLPGYTCESVIEPFIHEDYEIVFYSFNKDLEINLSDLENKILICNPSILLVHGFYGYNTFLPAKSIISKVKELGCIVIEDDTQTIFSKEDLIHADYYIGSIRKWMGIPDGAYICSENSLSFNNYFINERFIELVNESLKLKSDYTHNLDIKLKYEYKKRFFDAQNLIDNDLSIYKMAEVSKGILNLCNINVLKRKRIENYNYLFNKINKKIKGIEPVFRAPVEKEICPVYFPLFVENRNEFQYVLSENDVYATIIWPKSKYITGINDDTEYIYNNIIGIPCDQRYDIRDMQNVIDLIIKHLKK